MPRPSRDPSPWGVFGAPGVLMGAGPSGRTLCRRGSVERDARGQGVAPRARTRASRFRRAREQALLNPMPSGYLSFVLHAHLPYVRHPEFEDSLEERWLHEALTETYLPLLRMLEERASRGARGRITVSLSPTLLAMLEDPLLRKRYAFRMGRLLELTEREVARTRAEARFHTLAIHYRDRFRASLRQFEDRYRRDVPSAFR